MTRGRGVKIGGSPVTYFLNGPLVVKKMPQELREVFLHRKYCSDFLYSYFIFDYTFFIYFLIHFCAALFTLNYFIGYFSKEEQ